MAVLFGSFICIISYNHMIFVSLVLYTSKNHVNCISFDEGSLNGNDFVQVCPLVCIE